VSVIVAMIAVMALLLNGLRTLPNTSAPDLARTLGMVGQTAQLGDGLNLVDAAGSLEHGPKLAPRTELSFEMTTH